MNRSLLAILICAAITSSVALAGPNEGVVLAVHGNQGTMRSGDHPCEGIILPANCQDLIPTAVYGPEFGYWYLVVVVSPLGNTPNFNTVVFGLGNYPTFETYIWDYGPCAPDAIDLYTETWPYSGSGVAVAWAAECSENYLEPVFWFCVTGYGAGDIPLTIHPTHGGGVVDCEIPPHFDDFLAYGSMGVAGGDGHEPACFTAGVPPAERSTTWGNIKSIYR